MQYFSSLIGPVLRLSRSFTAKNQIQDHAGDVITALLTNKQSLNQSGGFKRVCVASLTPLTSGAESRKKEVGIKHEYPRISFLQFLDFAH